MKKDNHYDSKQFKISYKQVSIIAFVIILSIGISVYYGLAIAQSDMKMNPIIMHIHPKISITMDNKTMMVPSQIGIYHPLWNNHTLDSYGMQEMPGMSSMAPLHTHDNSGIIHVESSTNRNYTLGDFFKIWGIDLNDKFVNVLVDEKSISDYKNHILKDNEQINMNITSNK